MQLQFGEVESCSNPDTQLCTAVNGVQRKGENNHLKQGSPKKIDISSSVRCIGKIYTALHLPQTVLSFGTTFSSSRFYGLLSLVNLSSSSWALHCISDSDSDSEYFINPGGENCFWSNAPCRVEIEIQYEWKQAIKIKVDNKIQIDNKIVKYSIQSEIYTIYNEMFVTS